MSLRLLLSCAGCLAAFALGSVEVEADLVRLKNGGEVRGEIERATESDDSDVLLIHTLTGGRVTVDKSDVDYITRRSLEIEEYESRARLIADTVDAHWELAEWCKARRLKPQREEQLELLLDIDPDHAESRRILGHVRHNGQWMTREQWMESRGYILHRGKYVTQQELDLLEKSQAEREAETAWYPKVRLWFTWMSGRSRQRAAEGRANLEAIRDPDAAAALVNFLGDHESDGVRLFCVECLSRMQGPKPVRSLAAKSLFDESGDVRRAARQGISEDQQELALEYLVPELRHDSNTIVQRAASAIGEMGDLNVVPYLIEALVTSHKWKIRVPAGNTTSFGIGPNGQPTMLGSQSGFLPPEVELLARTGQLPYGAIVLPPKFQPRSTRTVTIKGDVKNSKVLAALKEITGQDFGYNQRDWQLWWQTQAHS